MPRPKKNLEKFLSTKIHNPPEIFQFEADGNIIMVDVLDKKVSVKPSTARVLRDTEVKLILNWIQVSSLSGSWSTWAKYIRPIITYYYINPETRKNLFKIFRESTQSKLRKSIREVKKLLKDTELKWEHLIQERIFLDARLNGYIRLDQKLKSEKAGHNKFLYPIIRPIFNELESLGYSKEQQCQIICNLYEIGNFDDFKDSIEVYDDGHKNMDKAMKHIRKIRIQTFKESLI